jgi:hypothetical protein
MSGLNRLKLPGMGQSRCRTGYDTGQIPLSASGLTGHAGIFDFLALLLGNHYYIATLYRVVRIFHYFQNIIGAGFHTFAATFTLIGIESNIIIPRTVFVAIVSNHI